MNLTDHNRQKKIAVINDFSGFGRCSLAVALPIISQLKIQCCPVPTSIFSNHTGFKHFFFEDYTDRMPEYIDNWKRLELGFNGILTGFLGSAKQIEIVKQFILDFRGENTHVIIDPVMGDNGKPYPTYTEDMCRRMKELVHLADVITPNLTEACILTDTPYTPDIFSEEDYYRIAIKLSELGANKIVITGISHDKYVRNIIYEKGQTPFIFDEEKVGHERSGTGDVFSSIVAASEVNGLDFIEAVKKASAFVKECIRVTEVFDIPPTDGVCFEEILHTLS